MTPTNTNSTASTGPIAPMEEVDMDEAVAAIKDAEDYKAIAEATAEEALVENLVEVDSGMEPDINKRSTISVTRQDAG